MKTNFMLAITQLSAEKHLPKDVVLSAVESALVSAYKKGNMFSPSQSVIVRINPATGEVRVHVRKAVVEEITDPDNEISLSDAQIVKTSAVLGETVDLEATPTNAGRIAAQTARQVIVQRLHEAEHNAVFEEYSDKEGDVVTGTIQRMESRQILLDVSRAEAVLPTSEQVRGERYRVGQRLRVYVMEVRNLSGRGPQIVVSRSHRNLLQRLFELEIPEIYSGTVEIKAVAREAGHRSKVAVAACQEGIDPVGCCVGLRGIRIQSIVNELNGEKIDVCQWHSDQSVFITNALSPAPITSVELNELERTVTVVVPDRQLSLAIGREGQNARLAARLTGWRIDIKSATAAEVEKTEDLVLAQGHAAPTDVEGGVEPAVVPEAPEMEQEPPTGEVAEDVSVEALTETTEPSAVSGIPPLDPSELEDLLAESKETLDKEEDGEVTPLEVALSAPDLFTPPKARQGTEGTNQIRFAEEVLVPRPIKSKRGKKAKEKETDSKGKKAKRIKETYLETESESGPEAGPETEPESGNENGET